MNFVLPAVWLGFFADNIVEITENIRESIAFKIFNKKKNVWFIWIINKTDKFFYIKIAYDGNGIDIQLMNK